MSEKQIRIRGCRVHNLKNIDIDIPRNKLVVITGLSGSGKSSLAFDTIYAEGQRRYVESLSSYARQFMDVMDKPDVDEISGLSPVIAIDQKSTINNPRSTIGTITEIYDLMRLMYSKIGIPHCPDCGKKVEQQTPEQIVKRVFKTLEGKKIFVLAPVIKGEKGTHKKILSNIRKADFFQFRLDGEIHNIEDISTVKVDKKYEHTIDIVVDSFRVEKTGEMKTRVKEVIEQALDLSNGTVTILVDDKELTFTENLYCGTCDILIPDVELKSFSFNNPYGACERCSGLGVTLEIDRELLIPNPRLTIAQGAIRVWSKIFANQAWYQKVLKEVAKKHKFSIDVEAEKMKKKHLDVLLYGVGDEEYSIGKKVNVFNGVIPLLEQRYKETDSDYIRKEIEKYMRVLTCPSCEGKRLNKFSLAVTVADKSITDMTILSIEKIIQLVLQLLGEEKSKDGIEALEGDMKTIGLQILNEVKKRLNHLANVGLGYLTLDRSAITLSGGEAQRIRLAKQLSSNLSEVIYVLDEPSIGLHPRDNEKLINTLKHLRDLQNTVIVVEHDSDLIKEADYVIDVGPGAGTYGGEIIAAGTPEEIRDNEKSLTGNYMSGDMHVKTNTKIRKGNGKKITIKGAEAFNLKNVSVDIPLGKFVCVTGVSGSGKSSLVLDILSRYLHQKFYRAKAQPEKFKEITGVENIDKVISIDQSPIGRTPRSNPATYTGVFTYIRDLFAQTPEAKLKGFDAGKFSFNVKGGRCEACDGDGMMKIDMQFLPDVYIECDECKGKRYKRDILEIYYREKNIADILDMTVKEALEFFGNVGIIREKLQTLFEVGLGYVHLGQSATTLSGGEAQRVKLATELSRRSTGKTLYILDEPTTGLHFDDISRLLVILDKLVDKGNTVLVIEHNLDVIKSSDWIIDMGPDGGDKGGELVVEGPPEKIIKSKKSLTGKFLKEIM